MKKLFLGLLFLTMSVVLVACSSGPKGTYKGKLMGSDITLKVDGKKGTMTGESSWLGETKEELTINAKEKTMKSDTGATYNYTQDGDTLAISGGGVTIKFTKEK